MSKPIKMKINYKSISIFLGVVVVLSLALGAALRLKVPVQNAPTPQFISTPSRDKYTEMLGNYAAQLQKEGLVNTGSIKLDVEQTPFILIFVPKTGEVTDDEEHGLMELIHRAAQVFDERKGLRYQDINLAFQRPAEQKIIFIKRTREVPAVLAEHGEGTLQAIDPKIFLSVIDLAEPLEEGEERDFHSAWRTVQAVCLGFSLQQQ